MKSHDIHPELLKHKVRVLVVGCGGNRSAVAAGLPYLHQTLLACGHPEGLHVTLLDPDIISPTNCVRQPFSQSEIGLYKSAVLANHALALLARLFRYGTISYHGAFIGLGLIGGVQPLRVNPKIWRRLRQKHRLAKHTLRTITSRLPVPAGPGSPSCQSHQNL